jgi:putative transposase
MRPTREQLRDSSAAYFVSTQTAQRQPFFRHERWAVLLEETLLHYGETGFVLHAYVIMPDHLHLLMVPKETLERAVQLIKGGFSFRAKKEFAWKFEVWQQGFTDHRIRDEADWQHHLEYIRQNPVEARLAGSQESYRFMAFPEPAFPQGLKPVRVVGREDVRAEARTLQPKVF